MGKQALYRKHRSKTLDEVVGQEHITDTLQNALKKGAISHAYLFTGPRGVGKTSIARILAHEINKLDYTDESFHLDIIEIDAASNRRIDEIRDLRDKVHIAPTTAKYKVYIIDEVHMLTREAFNALLKTLEEPPEHAVFILATTEAHKVPDTILSRTQRFTFRPITKKAAIDHLRSIAKTENIAISDEALALLAEHGQGSFRDSISMLDQLSGMAKDSYNANDVEELLGVPSESIIEELLASVAASDRAKLFAMIQTLREKGIDTARAAKAISSVLRDSLLDDKLLLPQENTLQLLRSLLDGQIYSDYLGLELALIDAMPNGKFSTPASAPQPANEPTQKVTAPIDRPKPEKIQEKSDDEKPTKNVKPPKKPDVAGVSTKPLDKAVWQEMLDEVKVTHNTLYGLLRMATPEQGDNEIILVLGFDFHKKQLESTKNKPIVRDYLKKYIGNAEFSAVVKKAANKAVDKPEEKRVDNNPSGDIDNVSNIFGSAQLLD